MVIRWPESLNHIGGIGIIVKGFKIATTVDQICRNCTHYDADMEIGGMYGLCWIALKSGKRGPDTVKEADKYCDEVEDL